MATWTNVPNSSIETDKPIRAVDIRALRDNPIAIAEGAAGAPRIVTDALENNERMTTSNVLGQTAGASINAVGSYALCRNDSSSNLDPGATVAGSNLRFASAAGQGVSGPSGTWRVMGRAREQSFGGPTIEERTSVFLRIS